MSAMADVNDVVVLDSGREKRQGFVTSDRCLYYHPNLISSGSDIFFCIISYRLILYSESISSSICHDEDGEVEERRVGAYSTRAPTSKRSLMVF